MDRRQSFKEIFFLSVLIKSGKYTQDVGHHCVRSGHLRNELDYWRSFIENVVTLAELKRRELLTLINYFLLALSAVCGSNGKNLRGKHIINLISGYVSDFMI